MLRDHLAHLEAAGLIRETASQPQLEYLFRHGLIQDAAYNTLLKQQRRAWHLAAGEVLEGLLAPAGAPDTADLLAPGLAHHFAVAGDDQRALRYFARAADAAFERYANAEAGDYYARALALATRAGVAYEAVTVRHLAIRLGLALELRSQFEAALRHYEAMDELAHRHADRALELAALLERAKIYSTANLSHDPERSRLLMEQAATLADRLGDHATQARLYWTLMLQNSMRGGDPAERLAYGERSLAVARELGLREQLAFTHQDLFFAYGGLGQWDQTRGTLLEAQRLWRELENPAGQCEAAVRLAMVAMFVGEYAGSLAIADEALHIARSIASDDMQALSHAFVGLIHAEHGDYAQAVTLTEAAMALGATTGNVTVLAGSQADLGLAYGELGAPERGLPLAQAALTLAESQFPLLVGWPTAAVARLHLMRGDNAHAEATLAALPPYQEFQRRAGFIATMWLNVALAEGELALAQGQAARTFTLMTEVAESMQATGLRFRLPDVLHLRAKARLAQGHLAQARSDLQSARLEALALNSRRMQWRILAALAEIEAQSGQADQAENWRRQARRVVQGIAEKVLTAELRQAFLAQADVQALGMNVG